ncbi:MAG: response regulator [Celeribacter sp.]|jgi:DNA-binding NtrC family response regulator
MKVLIVESEGDLGKTWQTHLESQGAEVSLAMSEDRAMMHLEQHDFDAIVLDLLLERGNALALADFIAYRQPKAQVMFVTNSTYFADGSIFQHASNARGFLSSASRPEDIAAMVVHYASGGQPSGTRSADTSTH